ncbi:uncharacterized protein LOC132622055 [Lycium barbarum]|uniref:uncharacterized protein LOC132622055 n=1 Tax=Lycium barbarum TaxID=112863 RepID=UPI00293F34DC|nr:uncharacterized protein LOC132622055 [Lycium barbarum]
MPIPAQATWMVRMIIEARHVLTQSQLVLRNNKSVIRQFYLHLIGQQERTSWKSLMFQNTATAKAKFTMWLHFHGKMLTSDRLIKWGISADPRCVLCQKLNKTRNHLFAECHYTRGLWNRVLTWLNRAPYTATTEAQYMNWLLSHSRGKSQNAAVFKMVLAEIVHGVWTERNLRIFEKRSRSIEESARLVACTCNIRAVTGTRMLLQRLVF